MLGSSTGGVQFAINEGLGFVFASHLAPHLAIPVLRGYRNNFKPSTYLSEPKGIFSTILITAETDGEAEYLAGPVELYWARLHTVIFIHHSQHWKKRVSTYTQQRKTRQESKIKIDLLLGDSDGRTETKTIARKQW